MFFAKASRNAGMAAREVVSCLRREKSICADRALKAHHKQALKGSAS
jgi:hypothetical protein